MGNIYFLNNIARSLEFIFFFETTDQLSDTTENCRCLIFLVEGL